MKTDVAGMMENKKNKKEDIFEIFNLAFCGSDVFLRRRHLFKLVFLFPFLSHIYIYQIATSAIYFTAYFSIRVSACPSPVSYCRHLRLSLPPRLLLRFLTLSFRHYFFPMTG